jgi:hypothetical protein
LLYYILVFVFDKVQLWLFNGAVIDLGGMAF